MENGEFDEEILEFLAKELDNAAERKKAASERRRIKKKEAKELKAKEEEAIREKAFLRGFSQPLLREMNMPLFIKCPQL